MKDWDWFRPEYLWVIPAVLFFVAGLKLQFRLDSFKKGLPKLQAKLVSFPISGTRIVNGDKLFAPQEGYAKITVINNGGTIEDCIGTVCSIAKLGELHEEIQIRPLVFTARQLTWDDGETTKTIPNDGVERYLNLAYLDQNQGHKWQLAINNSDDYFYGWHKIDVVISSLKTQMEPTKIEIALGLGDRTDPPSGLNLWPWDKWHTIRQRELKQASDKEGSQN